MVIFLSICTLLSEPTVVSRLFTVGNRLVKQASTSSTHGNTDFVECNDLLRPLHYYCNKMMSITRVNSKDRTSMRIIVGALFVEHGRKTVERVCHKLLQRLINS